MTYCDDKADVSWLEHAACRGMDTDLFFSCAETNDNCGRGTTREARRRLQVVRAVCRDCPVRLECVQHAIDEPEYYGIWGGLTRKERKTLRRNRQRKAA